MALESPSARLSFLRERSEYRSAAEFARAIGVPEVTYRAHESGLRGFGATQARRYARALNANWVWLLTASGHPYKVEPEGEGQTEEMLRALRPNEVTMAGGQPALGGDSDLPVYASAEGGKSGMIVNDDPIDWVKRPEPLLAVRGAFAVYVIGQSMEPRYEQGDMILVHPQRPVQQGDDVLLLAADPEGGRAALIKRLLHWSNGAWTVRQYNPPKDYELPRADWQQALVVVGKYNRR